MYERIAHRMIRMAALLPVICFAVSAFAQTAPENGKGKGAPILMLDFQNADDSDRYQASRLTERFKNVARAAVPPCPQAWGVRFNFAGKTERQIFAVKTIKRKREIMVTVPERASLWKNDPKAHAWLMSTLIMANLGESFRDEKFERINNILDHWLVRGLALKAAQSRENMPAPFVMPYPGAWALQSNGICPSVRQIVSGRVEGIPGVSVIEFELSYPGLLVEALSNAGFFRKKMAEPLLRAALAIPDADPYEAFSAFAKDLKIHTGKELTEADLDAWFRSYAEKTMISFFSPLSAEYFETVYRRITTFRFTDKDGIPQTCRIGNLVTNWEFLPDANEQIDRLLFQLNSLSFQAPGGFQADLSAIRLALARIRTDRTPEADRALRDAEKKLFEHIAHRVAVEKALAQSEAHAIPPSARFARTLDAVRMKRDGAHLLLPQIQSALDRWDDYR